MTAGEILSSLMATKVIPTRMKLLAMFASYLGGHQKVEEAGGNVIALQECLE